MGAETLMRFAVAIAVLLLASCQTTNVNVFMEGALPGGLSGRTAAVRLAMPEDQQAVAAISLKSLTHELNKHGVQIVKDGSGSDFLVSVDQIQEKPSARVRREDVFTPIFSPVVTIVYLSKRVQHSQIQKTRIRLSVSKFGADGNSTEIYYRVAVYEGSCGSLPEVVPSLYRALFSGFPDNEGRETILLNCDS